MLKRLEYADPVLAEHFSTYKSGRMPEREKELKDKNIALFSYAEFQTRKKIMYRE